MKVSQILEAKYVQPTKQKWDPGTVGLFTIDGIPDDIGLLERGWVGRNLYIYNSFEDDEWGLDDDDEDPDEDERYDQVFSYFSAKVIGAETALETFIEQLDDSITFQEEAVNGGHNWESSLWYEHVHIPPNVLEYFGVDPSKLKDPHPNLRNR